MYIKNTITGFRWPSAWVMTNHLVTGPIPRAFMGNLIKIIAGVNLYRKEVLKTIILITSIIFIIYIICGIAIKKKLLLLCIYAVFAVSTYAKYYLHESGYFEQYGHLLAILLLEITLRKNAKISLILSSIFAFISDLISETNLFLVIPLLFMIPAVKIFKENKNVVKRFIILILLFIPTVVYSIIASYIPPTMEVVIDLYNEGQKYVNFEVREDVYKYIYEVRSPAETWGELCMKFH